MPSILRVGMISQNSPGVILADDFQSRINQFVQGMQQAFALVIPPAPQRLPIFGAHRGPPPPLIAPPPRNLTGQNVLQIFLAPEYLFRRECQARNRIYNHISAYTAVQANTIFQQIRNISLQRVNCLVVGGSVFWVDPTLGNRVIRHTVPIYHMGHQLLLYEKKNDCGELSEYERVSGYRFAPGQIDGRFVCDGLRFGIETCLDHDLSQLKRDRIRDVDVHLVVSNSVGIKPANVVAQPRGYVLHCNAGVWGCRVYANPFNPSDGVSEITTDRTVANNCTIGHFALPWPAVVRGNHPAQQTGLRVLN